MHKLESHLSTKSILSKMINLHGAHSNLKQLGHSLNFNWSEKYIFAKITIQVITALHKQLNTTTKDTFFSWFRRLCNEWKSIQFTFGNWLHFHVKNVERWPIRNTFIFSRCFFCGFVRENSILCTVTIQPFFFSVSWTIYWAFHFIRWIFLTIFFICVKSIEHSEIC